MSAEKRLFVGDGRLVLEALPDEHLDFLAIDVFSGDAVSSAHPRAAEAYRTYLRYLNPNSAVAINITQTAI